MGVPGFSSASQSTKQARLAFSGNTNCCHYVYYFLLELIPDKYCTVSNLQLLFSGLI